MTRRHIHYEAAFEDYLRSNAVPYVPVDEHRKAVFAGARVKSFDFLVYWAVGPGWIVDVKGRKYPYDTKSSKRYWENWVTRADFHGLESWQAVFGDGFVAVFVFAYWLIGDNDRLPASCVHAFRDQRYAFLAVTLDSYRRHCRPRSASWDTVALSTAMFRRLARPVREFSSGPFTTSPQAL